MAGIDFSRPLAAAGAGAGSNWGSAHAETSLEFTGRAQFKRGINLAIGIEALATADANLSKFISATARGNAFASASAGAQLQLPLNLFDEFGIAVGAQAAAQAAAGIEVGLGISVGDFVALAQLDPDDVGLPIAMLLLLLEEVDVQARFQVNVSASAMAYASWRITGSVVDRPGRPAGFNYLVDAGLGCAAGVGFAGGAAAPFKNFRRFYGRATDRVVDETLKGVVGALPASASDLRAPLRALAPVVKTALRLAYEFGDYVVRNAPTSSPRDTANLCNHCTGVVLEEAQRYLFASMVEAAVRSLAARASDLASASAKSWDALRTQRETLADALYRMPGDPFQPDADVLAYWRDLAVAVADFAAGLPRSEADEMRRYGAIAYAASELLIEATASHVNQSHAYALAVGAGSVQTAPSFGGPVRRQPPTAIRAFIRASIGGGTRPLDMADLVQFLMHDVAIGTLRGALPEVDAFLNVFQGPVAATEREVAKLLIEHRHAFLSGGGDPGQADPVATLEVLLDALGGFIDTTVRDVLVPQANVHIQDPNVRLYFNEVLVATTLYTREVAFQTLVNWQRRPIGRDELTEALACVLIALFGRSVVLFGDTLFAALRRDMSRACAHAAQRVGGRNGALAALGLPDNALNRELLETVLNAGALVFEPLPEATRGRIRECLYEALEVLPPGEASELTDALADEFFIPSRERMDALMAELVELAHQRFERFLRLLFESAGEVLDAAIAMFLDGVAQIIDAWVDLLEDTLADVGRLLDTIGRTIADLEARVAGAALDFAAALESLLDALARPSMRNRIKNRIGDRMAELAVDELRRNPLYKALPLRELKRAARRLVRDVARAAVDNPLVNPLFDVLGALAQSTDAIIEDARSLDPGQPLAGQLIDLILDHAEDAARAAFGGTPHIDLVATFHYEFFGSHTVSFDLGRIDLPFSTLMSKFRSAVKSLDFYEDLLRDAADALARGAADALALEDERGRQRSERQRKARLERIEADLAPAERAIAILEPRAATTYDRDVEARIHLGGVPVSFLGLGQDEQQRVFVWINGVLVPPKSIALGDAIGSVSLSAHAGDVVLPPEGVASARGSIRSVVAPARDKSSAALSAPLSRPARPSTMRRAANALGPGVEITLRMALSELRSGSNTLTVALVDVGDLRHARTVSFAAAPPPRVTRGKATLRLPARPGTRPAGAPAAAPTGRIGRADLANAMTQATAYVAAQSALNLRPPRRGPR